IPAGAAKERPGACVGQYAGYSCPHSGKFLAFVVPRGLFSSAMQSTATPDDLLAHLGRLTPLGRGGPARLGGELLAYFSESIEEFVVRRHRELQTEDLRNEDIFERLAGELRQRRFTAPSLSQRQIRRLIYG